MLLTLLYFSYKFCMISMFIFIIVSDILIIYHTFFFDIFWLILKLYVYKQARTHNTWAQSTPIVVLKTTSKEKLKSVNVSVCIKKCKGLKNWFVFWTQITITVLNLNRHWSTCWSFYKQDRYKKDLSPENLLVLYKNFC